MSVIVRVRPSLPFELDKWRAEGKWRYPQVVVVSASVVPRNVGELDSAALAGGWGASSRNQGRYWVWGGMVGDKSAGAERLRLSEDAAVGIEEK